MCKYVYTFVYLCVFFLWSLSAERVNNSIKLREVIQYPKSIRGVFTKRDPRGNDMLVLSSPSWVQRTCCFLLLLIIIGSYCFKN